MADTDASSPILRYNLVSKVVEYFNGSDYYPIAVAPDQGITQLTGDVTAGPGSGSQVATVVSTAAVKTLHADAHANLTGNVQLVSGANVTLTQSGQAITITSTSGGSPGGSTTDVQVNTSGAFDGNAQLTFDKHGGLLTVVGSSDPGDFPPNGGTINIKSSDGKDLQLFCAPTTGNSQIVAENGSLLLTNTGTTNGVSIDANPAANPTVHIIGGLDAGSNIISNVTDPSNPQDAATKNYVDTHSGGGSPNVVIHTNTDQQSVGVNTWTNTNTTVTITPSSNTAKIKITATGTLENSTGTGYVTLFKDGSNVVGTQFGLVASVAAVPACIQWLDIPGDTSAHTYTVYIKSPNADSTTNWGGNTSVNVIIAEEIH